MFRRVIAGLLMLVCTASIAESNLEYYSVLAGKLEVQYNLPVGLLKTLCYQETRFQNQSGAHGEIGICQIKPQTVVHAFGASSYVAPHLPMLGVGSRGPAVIQLRSKLGLATDSTFFDEEVQEWVRGYQIEHHLRVDGVVGPQTWGSLMGHPSIEEQLWDPRTNMEYAAKYISWLSKVLGTTEPMILAAAYNGGPGNPVVKYMVGIQNNMVAQK